MEHEIHFRFAALEGRLADMHGIHSEKRSNFQARLKNLLRLGFPPGMGAKPGKASLYNERQVTQMALALELTQAGILPEKLVASYQASEAAVRSAVRHAAEALLAAQASRPHSTDAEWVDAENHFLFADPMALAPLMQAWGVEHQLLLLEHGTAALITGRLVGPRDERLRRLTVINVTTMLWSLTEPLGTTAQGIFWRRLIEWATTEEHADGDRS